MQLFADWLKININLNFNRKNGNEYIKVFRPDPTENSENVGSINLKVVIDYSNNEYKWSSINI